MKNLSTSLSRLLLLVAAGCGLASLATTSFACDHPHHNLEITSSHRNEEQVAGYRQDIEELTAIALGLGYKFADTHQVTFVAGPELNQLATNGRYALPHWIDGSKLLAGMRQVSGVLEFVTQGDGIARSFYSDTSHQAEQISIIMHVLGHNDFAQNSLFAAAKTNDSMSRSMKLARYLEELRREIGADEVDLFVQQLYSFVYLQDMVGGSYERPSRFEPHAPEAGERQLRRQAMGSSQEQASTELYRQTVRELKKRVISVNGEMDTPSVFSALTNFLPAQAPAWKKNIMVLFEEMVRHYPGNVQTKIINEGWATFSQFLLYRHSPRHQNSTVDYGGLLFGVVSHGRWNNPYWLGLECWRNLYKKFGIANQESIADAFERDRAFVGDAHLRMGSQSSYAFIRESLDEQWVKDKKLFVYRQATPQELSAKCGNDFSCYPAPDEQAFIALSRNHQRIINMLARSQADFSLKLPYLSLKHVNYKNVGGLLLEHDPRHGFPLNLSGMAKMLYLMARVFERPVTMTTVHYPQEAPQAPGAMESLEVTVTPEQDVSIVAATPGNLKEKFKEAIKKYEENLAIGAIDLSSRQDPGVQAIYKNIVDSIFIPMKDSNEPEQLGAVVSHAPTTSSAILAYEDTLNRRFAAILQLALQGKAPVARGKNGVSLTVMPEVPGFNFNTKLCNKIIASRPLAPLDSRSSAASQAYTFEQDDGAELESHPSLMPGDIFKKKKPQGQGRGEGDDDDDGEPEDGEDDEGGEGGSRTVDIPLEEWGKALQQVLGLPHLRRTEGGRGMLPTTKRKGVHKKNYGEIVWGRTIGGVLAQPLAQQLINGGEIDLSDIHALLGQGIRGIAADDYYVKNRTEHQRPKQRAVVVVVMDFSGSMMGVPHQVAAKMVFNLKALLKSEYPEVEFRYVVYDTKAQEMNEEDVFGKHPKFLGGGTSNVVGYEKGAEILAQYPYDQWNKFLLGIGDAGANDGPETIAIVEKIYPQLQYMAFVYTNVAGNYGDPGFVNAMKTFTSAKPWARFAEIADSNDLSVFRVLKELFPPNRK